MDADVAVRVRGGTLLGDQRRDDVLHGEVAQGPEGDHSEDDLCGHEGGLEEDGPEGELCLICGGRRGEVGCADGFPGDGDADGDGDEEDEPQAVGGKGVDEGCVCECGHVHRAVAGLSSVEGFRRVLGKAASRMTMRFIIPARVAERVPSSPIFPRERMLPGFSSGSRGRRRPEPSAILNLDWW